MSVSFIAPLAPLPEPAAAGPVAGLTSVASAAPLSGATFGSLVASGLEGVSRQLNVSQADLQGLATGNVENLHQVMIRLEESRVSFQLMLQVRNRLLESYQDVMRMQV